MKETKKEITGDMIIAACITENGEDTAIDVKLTSQEFEQMFGLKPQGDKIYYLTLSVEESDWGDVPTYGEYVAD